MHNRVFIKVLIIIFIISSLVELPLIKAKYNYKYAKTTVNIRASPNKKSKIVGKLYWNDKTRILKQVNKKWYQIQYKKKKRYVYVKYFRENKIKYKSYSSPSSKTFKSFEDAKYITKNVNIPQGKLKSQYHLDYHSGVWMVGNRYCIAVGSYYTKKIGVKIDLVLSHNGRKHTLKCIAADSKSDNNTVNKHRIHKDGSIVEFVVNTKYLSLKSLKTGDVSYANKKYKGKIIKINVYK